MFAWRSVMAVAVVALMVSVCAAQNYGTNLILNPGAELGTLGYSGDNFSRQLTDWVVVTGPTSAAGFSGYAWGAPGGFPTLTDPGPQPPASRGESFFYGGQVSTAAAGQQVVAITSSSLQTDIDALGVSYHLAGWFGGYLDHPDNARLTVRFLSAGQTELGSAVVGPVSNGDRGNQTGLLFRETLGMVPGGTRSMEFTLSMIRVQGSANDGYADNLSLVLSTAAVPEPATVGLFLIALGVLAVGYFRRSQHLARAAAVVIRR